MIDPIADILTRIRNASRALLPTVAIPHSKM
jgi:ribosomal protein S8